MSELEADIAIVTETWLQDEEVSNSIIDSAGNFALNVSVKNRSTEAANGRQYGGVAIFSKIGTTNFKPVTVANPDNFEVHCLVGKGRWSRKGGEFTTGRAGPSSGSRS